MVKQIDKTSKLLALVSQENKEKAQRYLTEIVAQTVQEERERAIKIMRQVALQTARVFDQAEAINK